MKFESVNRKYNKLNDFIRGEMKRKKINQKTAANWLNIQQNCVSSRLCGQTEWTAREIISIFELLEIQDEWKW